MSEVEHYMEKAQEAANLRRLNAELKDEVRMAGIIFDSVIKTCAPLLALYPDDAPELTWDEIVGIAAEELVALREAGDALAEMVRDVQPYLPSIPVARLDAALDRWEQTR